MKKVVSAPNAPAAVGPYSQANVFGKLVFVSGQLPIDTATNSFPALVEEQTAVSLTNLKTVLEAAGSSMDKVLKTTVFLNNMDNFNAMNKVYATFFTEGKYPSRSAVEVNRLPKGALVEIEAVAYID